MRERKAEGGEKLGVLCGGNYVCLGGKECV